MTTLAQGTVEHARATQGAHAPAVMRQTQGLIGLVLLVGAAGIVWIDRSFVALPIIIGLGLTLAGLSGACPMASLMARMPWNRARARGEGCGCATGPCQDR